MAVPVSIMPETKEEFEAYKKQALQDIRTQEIWIGVLHVVGLVLFVVIVLSFIHK